jgi:hypothetical protein
MAPAARRLRRACACLRGTGACLHPGKNVPAAARAGAGRSPGHHQRARELRDLVVGYPVRGCLRCQHHHHISQQQVPVDKPCRRRTQGGATGLGRAARPTWWSPRGQRARLAALPARKSVGAPAAGTGSGGRGAQPWRVSHSVLQGARSDATLPHATWRLHTGPAHSLSRTGVSRISTSTRLMLRARPRGPSGGPAWDAATASRRRGVRAARAGRRAHRPCAVLPAPADAASRAARTMEPLQPAAAQALRVSREEQRARVKPWLSPAPSPGGGGVPARGKARCAAPGAGGSGPTNATGARSAPDFARGLDG